MLKLKSTNASPWTTGKEEGIDVQNTYIFTLQLSKNVNSVTVNDIFSGYS